jgi:hypothetical protein
VLVHDDGTRFAVLASHADENLTVKPALANGERPADLGDQLAVEQSPSVRSR